MVTFLSFGLGLALLIVGAELLVRGAAALALRFDIPPLIVGLTIVAMGTSAPELAVSIDAALRDRPEIALGNAVGSNNINILLILGLAALVAPLAVSHRLVRRDVPILIGISVLLHVLAADGILSLLDGLILVGGMAAYLFSLFRDQAAAEAPIEAALPPSPLHWATDAAFVAVGLVMLAIGSDRLVDAASMLAAAMGVSQLVIGLTVVALGTSLPELVTSITATIRGERDIAVGNVVGSNIFNILLVLGTAALVSPGGVSVPGAALTFDIPVMIAVSIACLPIFFTGYAIERWEGGVFLGYYIAYTVFLFLDATGHAALPVFVGAMALFVLPLTVLTLVILVGGELGLGHRE